MLPKKQRKAVKKVFKDLSKEKKEKNWQHGCELYKNFPEHERQWLAEYRN